jgi:hypothetical protein
VPIFRTPKLRGLRDRPHLQRCLIINPYDLGKRRGRHVKIGDRRGGLVAGWAVSGTRTRHAAIATAAARTALATPATITLAIGDLLLSFVLWLGWQAFIKAELKDD